jgi:succinate dehydrogenase/fumarate reductase cytochrome b subunit
MNTDPSIDRRLMRVQAASGAAFALFLLVHLGNTMVAMAGPAAYDAVQGTLRAAYQVPPIEVALVIGPLVVHVAASVARMLRRRRLGQPAPRALRSRLHRWSAVVLLVFTLGHVVATRGASLIFGVWPEFDGVAFTMVWTPLYFIPYYTVFAIAGLYHVLHGLTVALPRLGLRGANGRWTGSAVYGCTIAGALAIMLGVAGFAGAFDRTVRGRAVDSAYARLLVELGVADAEAREGAK